MMNYYPLAPGNKWEYKQKDGSVYTNSVISVDGSVVSMKNSTVPDPTNVKVENGVMYNELMGKDNYQLWLKDDLKQGETWDASFTANGLNSIMAFTVKETKGRWCGPFLLERGSLKNSRVCGLLRRPTSRD